VRSERAYAPAATAPRQHGGGAPCREGCARCAGERARRRDPEAAGRPQGCGVRAGRRAAALRGCAPRAASPARHRPDRGWLCAAGTAVVRQKLAGVAPRRSHPAPIALQCAARDGAARRVAQTVQTVALAAADAAACEALAQARPLRVTRGSTRLRIDQKQAACGAYGVLW
jgi:hypothetical protein